MMMFSNEQIAALGGLPSRFDVVDNLLRQVLQTQAQTLQTLRDTEQSVIKGQAQQATDLQAVLAAIEQSRVEQTELLQQILGALVESPSASKFVIDQQAVNPPKKGK